MRLPGLARGLAMLALCVALPCTAQTSTIPPGSHRQTIEHGGLEAPSQAILANDVMWDFFNRR